MKPRPPTIRSYDMFGASRFTPSTPSHLRGLGPFRVFASQS
ncbi:Protein of unknown function [Pyronema omphalodes CBS 100304]|uniref:Uncharacterized protein n=1 Tax=Pyronema omphalodes (strain CBS 100304) TaxID=1076935 RepID=U4LHD6_PYROM|nr:Protein of unknown function [Pyronema omphalodes CBS 100304]